MRREGRGRVGSGVRTDNQDDEDWSVRTLTPKSTWSLLLLVGPRALMRHYYVLNPDRDSIDWECLMVNNAITIIIAQLIKVIMASNDLWEGGGGPSSRVWPDPMDISGMARDWNVGAWDLSPSPDCAQPWHWHTASSSHITRPDCPAQANRARAVSFWCLCGCEQGPGVRNMNCSGGKKEEGEWFYGSSRKMVGSTICKWLVLIGNTPRPS